jgi:hypothetical protein
MRRWLFWSILVVCFLCAWFLRIYPLTIVQPFLRQFPEALLRALLVFRIAPALSAGLAAAALMVTILTWRKLRVGSRIGAGLLVLLTCAAAVLVRINVFELMFHPAGAPAFLTNAQAKLDPDDMLITVVVNGDARAYPIREMAYHHVVNDFAGGVAILPNY